MAEKVISRERSHRNIIKKRAINTVYSRARTEAGAHFGLERDIAEGFRYFLSKRTHLRRSDLS